MVVDSSVVDTTDSGFGDALSGTVPVLSGDVADAFCRSDLRPNTCRANYTIVT